MFNLSNFWGHFKRLIKSKKETGLKGTQHLARLLNRIAVFEKDKNENEFISM